MKRVIDYARSCGIDPKRIAGGGASAERGGGKFRVKRMTLLKRLFICGGNLPNTSNYG